MHLLPLGLLALLEGLQDSHHLLQRNDLLVHLRDNLGLVITQLGVEVLAVRSRGHGSAEDGLDQEGVVRLEGTTVGLTEGLRQLLGGVVEVVAEGLGSEVETTIKEVSDRSLWTCIGLTMTMATQCS